jgi:hypothetical protein
VLYPCSCLVGALSAGLWQIPVSGSHGAGITFGPGLALRATAPVDNFGFIDLVPHVVDRRQARRGADGAVDVGSSAAGATDHVVVIVADPSLKTRG